MAQSKPSTWRLFLTGRLHVYYGLLVLILLAIYQVQKGEYVWLIVLIVSVGCFVDLWAHTYRH